MSDRNTDRRRRRFIHLAVASAMTAPVIGLLGSRPAEAADTPRLDPESRRARQLSYTHDASSTDHSAHEEGARCANCTHFRGKGGAQWATCNIFPEHRVNADGWCTSWYSAG